MAEKIDGRAVARALDEKTKAQVDEMVAAGMRRPGLTVILVGDDGASEVYVRRKIKACEKVGIISNEHRLPADTSQEDLLALIDKLNKDPEVHGILCQVPLPKHIDTRLVLRSISPEKDVDGFHPVNVGRLSTGTGGIVPCTPLGVLRLLECLKLDLAGRSVVLVGRGALVGRPLAQMLSAPPWDATVTLCHSQTRNLPGWTSQAEVLISATGVPGLIRQSMVRPGAVVIDVGNTAVADPSSAKGYRMAGDVAFEEVSKVASWITPVPGGVGPMTIAMLLENTLRAVRLQHA